MLIELFVFSKIETKRTDIMKEKIYNSLAENIRYARLQKKMSQEELAEKVNVSANYIYQIESGRVRMGLSALLEIKEVLDMPAKELFGEEEYGIYDQQEIKEIIFIIEKAPKKERIILLDTIRSLNASFSKVKIK